MKKILFTALLAVIASTGIAQPKASDAIHKRIKTEYNEGYTIVSIDTVAMPIRMVMSLNYAMTTYQSEASKRLGHIIELQDAAFQTTAIKKLAKDMEKNLEESITVTDIVAMRNSNAPHKDNYYNYQRTIVYLEESQREETFYIRLGEESISMTHLEYDRLEADTFLKYWNYRDLMKKLKELSNTD